MTVSVFDLLDWFMGWKDPPDDPIIADAVRKLRSGELCLRQLVKTSK